MRSWSRRAGPSVPDALKGQLAIGGRLVIPVGDGGRHQTLLQGHAHRRDRVRARRISARVRVRAADRRAGLGRRRTARREQPRARPVARHVRCPR